MGETLLTVQRASDTPRACVLLTHIVSTILKSLHVAMVELVMQLPGEQDTSLCYDNKLSVSCTISSYGEEAC